MSLCASAHVSSRVSPCRSLSLCVSFVRSSVSLVIFQSLGTSLSVSFCVPLGVSLSKCVSLCVHICVSLCVCHCVSPCIALCLHVFLCVCLSVFLCLSLCVSLGLCACLCLYVFLYANDCVCNWMSVNPTTPTFFIVFCCSKGACKPSDLESTSIQLPLHSFH